MRTRPACMNTVRKNPEARRPWRGRRKHSKQATAHTQNGSRTRAKRRRIENLKNSIGSAHQHIKTHIIRPSDAEVDEDSPATKSTVSPNKTGCEHNTLLKPTRKGITAHRDPIITTDTVTTSTHHAHAVKAARIEQKVPKTTRSKPRSANTRESTGEYSHSALPFQKHRCPAVARQYERRTKDNKRNLTRIDSKKIAKFARYKHAESTPYLFQNH